MSLTILPKPHRDTTSEAKDMAIVVQTTTTYNFTLGELRRAAVGDFQVLRISRDLHRNDIIALVASTIRANRFELLNSYAPYRVITNGYGHFKCVEFDGKTIPANTIFDKLERIAAL